MFRSLCLAVGALCCTAGALAQCPTVNFENLAVGTAVTDQYQGVTFSLSGTGCPGTAFCRIIAPEGGTSSGTRALGRDQGCPDFYLGNFNLVFDDPTNTVRFRLGEWGGGSYTIRAYNAAVGGTLLLTRVVSLPGDALTAVYYPVELVATGIRRIEIQQSFLGQTVIDDLEFKVDTTPPTALLSAPAEGSCFCSGMAFFGTANDADGELQSWTLQRRPAGTPTWTLITTSTLPVVSDELSNWFPAASAPEGYYIIRLSVENVCGLTTATERLVYLDRAFDSLSIRYPGADAIVGGSVCIDGTAWDHCPPAADVFSVDYAPLPAGTPFTTIAPDDPVNDSTVITDQLASWNTRSPVVADGTYRIRVTGTTSCGETDVRTVDVIVDNTPPVVIITSPTPCDFVSGTVQVRGTITDAHMGGWSLYYSGGDTHEWVRISTGIGPVLNGVLGNWNTAGLRDCVYMLRVVATDRSQVDCNTEHNVTDRTVAVTLGCTADFNSDGFVNSQDFFDFLTAFFAGCP